MTQDSGGSEAAGAVVSDREQVRQAALFMDGVKPDWWRNVDPLTFDLFSPTKCVCGQNDLRWVDTFGFTGSHPAAVFVTSSREYEPLWLEEIASRMPSPVPLPVPASTTSSSAAAQDSTLQGVV